MHPRGTVLRAAVMNVLQLFVLVHVLWLANVRNVWSFAVVYVRIRPSFVSTVICEIVNE